MAHLEGAGGRLFSSEKLHGGGARGETVRLTVKAPLPALTLISR